MPDLPTGALIVRDQSKGTPRPVIYIKFRDYTRERSPQVERRIGPGWLVRIGEPGAKRNGKTIGRWRERAGRNVPDGYYTPDTARERAPEVIADFYAERERESAAHGAARGEDVTLAQAAEAWLAWERGDDERGWKHSTAANAVHYARRLVREIEARSSEGVLVRDITTQHLYDALDGMRPMRNGVVIGDALSKKAKRDYAIALGKLFAYCVRVGWIADTPAVDLISRGDPRRAKKSASEAASIRDEEYLTVPQVWDVIAQMEVGGEPRAAGPGRRVEPAELERRRTEDAAMVATMAFAGLRVGEAVALRWRDVDFQADKLNVRKSRTLGTVGDPKSGTERSVPMPPELAQRLATVGLRSVATGGDDPVFLGATGGYVEVNAFRDRYRDAQRRAGIEPLRKIHALRHSYAVSLARRGVELAKIQALLGHTSIATTQVYARFVPDSSDLPDGVFARPEIATEPGE